MGINVLDCLVFLDNCCSHVSDLRSGRQTSEQKSSGSAKNKDRVGRGNNPSALQQHHPDLGRSSAGGETPHHVVQ